MLNFNFIKSIVIGSLALIFILPINNIHNDIKLNKLSHYLPFQKDNNIEYSFRGDRWEGIHPPEDKAGIYINLIAAYVLPADTKAIKSTDSIRVNFYLPGEEILQLEVREEQNDYLMLVEQKTWGESQKGKTEKFSWPTDIVLKKLRLGVPLQCDALLPLAYRKILGGQKVFPIRLTGAKEKNGSIKDRKYKFLFVPNADIKINYGFYSISNQDTVLLGQIQRGTQYGKSEFPIYWNAKVNDQPVSSGNYLLRIEGRARYFENRVDFIENYPFFHSNQFFAQ